MSDFEIERTRRSDFARLCFFLPYFIDPWTGAVAFNTIAPPSFATDGHMHAARATPRWGFLCMAGVGKNSEARDLPSAELGGRQAAGVLRPGVRPAWALATRAKKRVENP